LKVKLGENHPRAERNTLNVTRRSRSLGQIFKYLNI